VGCQAAPHRSDDAPRMAFRPLAEIERMPEDERWLVEGLVSSGGLLVLAATPKSGKTWVSLAVGVSVASGKTLIGNFHVARPGRVMLFPAEDDVRSVRERIESLCAGIGISFEDLPIDVITADRLQLDREDDRALLEQLLAERQPKLLVLDSLVRLHGGAENYVGHIADLLGRSGAWCLPDPGQPAQDQWALPAQLPVCASHTLLIKNRVDAIRCGHHATSHAG
jgi:hypothetical protein